MKNPTPSNIFTKSLILSAAILVTLASASKAALIVYDGFDYTAGADALPSQNGGIGWSGAWSATPNNNVASSGFTYSNLQTSGNSATTDDNGFGPGSIRFFTTAQTGTIWISGFVQSNGPGGGFVGFNLLDRLDTANNNGALNFGQKFNESILALYGDNVGGLQELSSGLSSGNLNFVAAQINLSGGAVTWYVNPTGLGSGSAPTGAAYTGSTTFSSFTAMGVGLRGNTSANFDEIRVGETWQDVSPVPEPSTYVMAIAGGLLLFFIARRRRLTA